MTWIPCWRGWSAAQLLRERSWRRSAVSSRARQSSVLGPSAASERWPRLARTSSSPASLDPVAAELDRCIEPDGNVADRASPELGRARRAVTDTRKDLGQRLGQLIRRYSDVLSDEYWTERDGRYVLPVRSDAHLKVRASCWAPARPAPRCSWSRPRSPSWAIA